MKIIHISPRHAIELIANIDEECMDTPSVKDLIKEVEGITGACYDPINRCWLEPK